MEEVEVLETDEDIVGISDEVVDRVVVVLITVVVETEVVVVDVVFLVEVVVVITPSDVVELVVRVDVSKALVPLFPPDPDSGVSVASSPASCRHTNLDPAPASRL